MQVNLSEELRAFLTARLQHDEYDYDVASFFLNKDIAGDPDEQDFFDARLIDGEPRLTYTTRERLSRGGPDADPYAIKTYRMQGRPAAVAQRVTGVTHGRALDIFAGALRDHLIPPPPIAIEVVTGERISWAYNEDNTCACQYNGSLDTSCMRPRRFAEGGYFQLWEDIAELVVIFCPRCEKTRARTLVITDSDHGRRAHNRIYATESDARRIRAFLGPDVVDATRAYRGEGEVPPVFRVEAHAKGYERFPSLDYFSYCFACQTVSLATTPCEGTRSYAANRRPCIPSTRLFPREESDDGNENPA